MKFPRICLALAALFLPSCFIYDESLLGPEDGNPSSGGADASGGAPGSGGDITASGGTPGSGGEIIATGGTGTGSGGGTDCDAVGTTMPFSEVTSGVPYFMDAIDESVAFDSFDGFDRNFLPAQTIGPVVLDGSWNPTQEATAAVATWVNEQDACLPEFNMSLHGSGSGFTAWGAGYDGQLANPITSINLSAYTGIVFWARTSAATNQLLRIDVTDEGGAHMSTALTIVAGSKWRAYQVPFSAVSGLDTTKVRLVHILAPTSASGAFDYWVDDPSFYKKVP